MKSVSIHPPASSIRFKKIFNGPRKMYFPDMNDENGLWVRVRKPALYHIRFRARLV
jgi:hypothetical protein